MQISITFEISDDKASQIIQDAGLAVGLHGMTDAEIVERLKEKVKGDMRALVLRGTAIRQQQEQQAAAEAELQAAVSVS